LPWSLVLLIVSLLLVGVVSHTVLRHVIQAIPPAVAWILVVRGSQLGPAAAAPIVTFWLGVMISIWMFLLDVASIFTGTFTSTEIVLTIAIALSCGLGIAGVVRQGSRAALGTRLGIASAFGIAQFVAMIASFQPMFR
jgi:hypothetical protein